MAVRIDDSRTLKAAPDELLVGQVTCLSCLCSVCDECPSPLWCQLRDWNEEFQVARELPVTTASLKMYRDRTVFKVVCVGGGCSGEEGQEDNPALPVVA